MAHGPDSNIFNHLDDPTSLLTYPWIVPLISSSPAAIGKEKLSTASITIQENEQGI